MSLLQRRLPFRAIFGWDCRLPCRETNIIRPNARTGQVKTHSKSTSQKQERGLRRYWTRSRQSAGVGISLSVLWHRKTTVIAALSIVAILSHLVLRFGFHATPSTYQIPLLATLVLGGLPLLYDLLRKLLKREFGSDLLGGISIITSVLLGEYLAGSIIVLMLSGGEALESYALRSASSVLAALAKRMPSIAHRKAGSEIAGRGAGRRLPWATRS